MKLFNKILKDADNKLLRPPSAREYKDFSINNMKIKTEKEKLLMKKRSYKDIIDDVIDDKY